MLICANLPGIGFAQVAIDGAHIRAVELRGAERDDEPSCSPGFVDLQINGFAGVDFSCPHLEVDALLSVLPPLWSTGVTSFCPTLITNSIDALDRNFRILEKARAACPEFAASVPGYHLEGPFLSSGPSHGAHDPRWMRAPDWSEFEQLQVAAGGNIRILTLAPELPGALNLIRGARHAGVSVGISHTDGNSDDVHQAVAAGARLATHLGNGCPEMIHRHRAPLWAQLAADDLYASIICDKFHLPSDVVKVIYRVKGRDRCLLVTDAVHVANQAPGRYALVGTPIDLLPSGQVVRTDGGSMAGSALSMDFAVYNFMELAGTSLAHALYAGSSAPASFLGQPSMCNQIAPGQAANLILVRPEVGRLRVEQTVLNGRRMCG
jgi:N-acetylglucosamine-6-phosphate deacetylase